MTDFDQTAAQIAEKAAARLLAAHGVERGVGEIDQPGIEPPLQAFAWELGDGEWSYEQGLKALVHQALLIAAEQQPTALAHDEECGHNNQSLTDERLVRCDDCGMVFPSERGENPIIGSDERDLEVGVWPAHPDMAADGGPDAIVVQIDTGESTGRLRVNINDAAVWDGDPETDQRPGAWFHTEPQAGTEEHSVARPNISNEDLQTLVDAADKWSTELDDYVIPFAEESDAADAAEYRAEMAQIDEALARTRPHLTQEN